MNIDTWEDKCPPKDHVDADICLDPNHDKLSWERICEVKDYKESLTTMTIPANPASIQDNEPIQDDNPELDLPSTSLMLAEKIYKSK
jgi:hypothetical protein